MVFEKNITVKNGLEVLLRSGTEEDGAEVFELFNKTHAETDYLLSYPDENSYTAEEESEFLKKIAEDETGIEMMAVVNGRIVGMAGFEAVGRKYKVKHRADFGISVLKEYWGLGIGRALTNACIECAKKVGYTQLELTAVAENSRAIALYESVGFTEYGRNPKGFHSRSSGYQEIIHMRLEL